MGLLYSALGAALNHGASGRPGAGLQGLGAAGGPGWGGVISPDAYSAVVPFAIGTIGGGAIGGYITDLFKGKGLTGTVGGAAGGAAATLAFALGQSVADFVCTQKCKK
jgi:hypothetical protein